MPGSLWTFALTLMANGTTGCDRLSVDPEEEASQDKECGRCHQSFRNPEGGFTPLLGRGGDHFETVKDFHDRHLQSHLLRTDGPLTAPLFCADCHTVPEKVTAPGHVNGDPTAGAEVVFPANGRARERGVEAHYDPETRTCTVACHGTGLNLGGVDHSPPLEEIPAEGAGCRPACHAVPPQAPHWQNMTPADCPSCHPDRATHHINGAVERPAEEQICLACHDQPPGRSPLGDETQRRDHIGAHQAHLVEKTLSENVQCEYCHEVPAVDNDLAGHRDGDGRADVVFSGMAVGPGAAPSFDPETARCQDVYCHNGKLEGGKINAPQWNDASGDPKKCDSCHGAPPDLPHMQPQHPLKHRGAQEKLECEKCHDETAGPSLSVKNKTTHVNGRVDVKEDICEVCHGQPPAEPEHDNHPDRRDCWSCHPSVGEPEGEGQRPKITDPARHNNGTIDLFDDPHVICLQCHGHHHHGNFAPPMDTRGNVAREVRGVGAHQEHLHTEKTTHVKCSCCHNVPQTVFDEGHRNGTVEIIFKETARLDEVEPEYDPQGQSCTVYCHGITRDGGKIAFPLWTDLSGDPAECDSCHGAPPPLPHMQPQHQLKHREEQEKLPCEKCHDKTAGPDQTIVFPKQHLNGTIDVKEDICEVCHGQPPAKPDHGNHPDRRDCWHCHPTVEKPAREGLRPVILEAGEGQPAHNNGTVDLLRAPEICTRCHGTPARGPAPLPDGQGRMDNAALGIFHSRHLKNTITANVECASCHTVYQTVFEEGHRDGTADVIFGGVALLGRRPASYDSAAKSCIEVYCHGASLTGNRPDPGWQNIRDEAAHCDFCHGFPPQSHRADQDGDGEPDWLFGYNSWGETCQDCHITPLENGGNALINPLFKHLHMDGVLQEREGF